MNCTPLYAVALKDAVPDREAAEAFLAGRLGDRARAREFLRRNPGYLGRCLPRDAAARLRVEAADSALDAALFEEDSLKAPSPLGTARLELKGLGLRAQAAGAEVFIRYEDVSLIAAAAYDAPAPAPDLSVLKDGLFSRIRGLAGAAAAEPEPRRETFFRADVVAADGLRLLLEPENMDFSTLGSRRAHASLPNFRLLLEDLAAACTGAASNAFLKAFVSSGNLTPLKVAGPEAADEELARLLLLGRRR